MVFRSSTPPLAVAVILCGFYWDFRPSRSVWYQNHGTNFVPAFRGTKSRYQNKFGNLGGQEFLKFVRPLGSPPYPRLLPRPAARAPPAACCPLLATRCPLHAARTCLTRPVASTHATVATVARRSHSDARQVRTWCASKCASAPQQQ